MNEVSQITPRLIKNIQGLYETQPFNGKNESGYTPIGKRVLVLMDEAAKTFAGGKMEFVAEQIERMSLASESGTIVETGPQAFELTTDGTRQVSYKPKAGDHVYVEKYAGLLIKGDDNRSYRLMEDSCVGAVKKTAE